LGPFLGPPIAEPRTLEPPGSPGRSSRRISARTSSAACRELPASRLFGAHGRPFRMGSHCACVIGSGRIPGCCFWPEVGLEGSSGNGGQISALSPRVSARSIREGPTRSIDRGRSGFFLNDSTWPRFGVTQALGRQGRRSSDERVLRSPSNASRLLGAQPQACSGGAEDHASENISGDTAPVLRHGLTRRARGDRGSGYTPRRCSRRFIGFPLFAAT